VGTSLARGGAQDLIDLSDENIVQISLNIFELYRTADRQTDRQTVNIA